MNRFCVVGLRAAWQSERLINLASVSQTRDFAITIAEKLEILRLQSLKI